MDFNVSKTEKFLIVKKTKRIEEITEAWKSLWEVLDTIAYFKLFSAKPWFEEGNVFPQDSKEELLGGDK